MYEPLIIEKKKPRTLAGTPGAKVSAILNFSKIFAYSAVVLLYSNYLMRKKKLICELDEVEVSFNNTNKNLKELQNTKEFWKYLNLEGVVSMVVHKYRREDTENP